MHYTSIMSAIVASMAAGMALPRLKRIRLQKSFSQADLAARAGIAPRTVTSAEAGYGVSLRTTRKLAEVLGVEPDELRAESPE
jgi:transcriptional regulator with XRE-family HTH domain